jgi:hypothetical protein
MEIMIAMALTAIVTASVLTIVRTQLMAFQMNDQVVRTQQNTRAGMDLVETIVRRACAGINTGVVQVYTPTVSGPMACLHFVDGAKISATSLTSSDAKLPDALEVIYATGTMTALTTPAPTLSSTTPSITVLDASGFAVNDFVILTDASYANPAMFQISNITGNTLSLGVLGTAPTTVPTVQTYQKNVQSGTPVFKAATYSFFVVPDDKTTIYGGMLMIDSNGVVSTNHTSYGSSSNVQPAVDGVIDFQIAVGNDLNDNGVMDWVGDTWGESLAATPWNSSTLSTMPQYRQVRISLLLNTLDKYAGTPLTTWTTNAFEDRPATSYPTITTGGFNPRYRSVRMTVAPRAWNLSE